MTKVTHKSHSEAGILIIFGFVNRKHLWKGFCAQMGGSFSPTHHQLSDIGARRGWLGSMADVLWACDLYLKQK